MNDTLLEPSCNIKSSESSRTWKTKCLLLCIVAGAIVGLSFLTARGEDLPEGLRFLSAAFGWGYFFAWSLSFYPQVGLMFVETRLLALIPHSRKYSECKLLPIQPNYSLAQGAFESPTALYDWSLSRFPDHKPVRLCCIFYL